VCASYWDGPGNVTLEQGMPVWPSKEACCQAGGGAYERGALFEVCSTRARRSAGAVWVPALMNVPGWGRGNCS